MYLKALAFATKKHLGQKRRGGKPYINHPMRVSEAMDTNLERSVAVLHDVLEDTDTTLNELIKTFGKEVSWHVAQLSHLDDQSYIEYISNLTDPLCIKVKIADIKDNLSDTPTDKQKEKYKEALVILQKHANK